MTLPIEYMALPKRPRRAKYWQITSIATIVALGLSVITLFLTLLGYGHELGFLEKLGLRPEDLQYAPLDFLMRSWRPFGYLIIQFGKGFTQDGFWQFFTYSWWGMFWILLMLPLITAIGAWFYTNKEQRFIQISISAMNHTRNMIVTRWKKHWQAFPTRKWGYAGWLGFPLFFAATTGVWLAVSLAIAVILLGIAYIPMWGLPSGREQAQNEVLFPLSCIGKPIKQGQDSDRQAQCLRVMRDDKELARGRLIEYGADRVFLYQPSTKHWLSVPLRNAIVEEIDSLDIPNPGKPLQAK